MIFNISAKNCQISELWYEDFEKYAQKLLRLLPHFDNDTLLLDLVISKHNVKDLYEGKITLHLPMKTLHINFKGYEAEKEIHKGFDKLMAEIKKYKTKHFTSFSKFPNNETIRKMPEIIFETIAKT